MVQDSYGAAAAYLGKARGTQNREQRYRNFSNLIPRSKFHEAVRFIYEREMGVVFLPENWANDKKVVAGKTVVEVLAVKHLPERKFHCFYVGGV